MAEQVYKDIVVFKGYPASDIIPAMEFMSASMNYKCVDCHEPNDYAAPHRNKETTRKMVLMQREINTKNFNGRLEVTCMTCHHKKEHPEGTPVPEGINLQHMRFADPPRASEVLAKHVVAAGPLPAVLIRTGTLTAPNDQTQEEETKPVELIQAAGGKFRLVSGERKFGSDGKQVWYGPYPMTDEPAAIFTRIGRTYFGEGAFAGLERPALTGRDKLGEMSIFAVKGNRPSTQASEEFWFDEKTGLIVRLVNMRPSSVGIVVSAIDYDDYKAVAGSQVPMKVTFIQPTGDRWTLEFKEAKVEKTVDEAIFKMPAAATR